MPPYHRSSTSLLAVFFLCFAASLPCQAVTAVFNAADHIPVTSDGYTASGTLQVSLGAAPKPGADLTVVKNTGRGFIEGSFSNVANGAAVDLPFGGFTYKYVAWYYGGEGNNDLVLLWRDVAPAAWGSNASGQLGDNTIAQRRVPVAVNGTVGVPQTGVLKDKTIAQLARGGSHTLALCTDGTVAAWGSNQFGQLGNRLSRSSGNPVLVHRTGVLNGKRVISLAAGKDHSLALCSDGTVVAWGLNADGQLGDGSRTNRNAPVAVNSSSGSESALHEKSVVMISAGNSHSLALTEDGKVAAWGSNFYGQIGDLASDPADTQEAKWQRLQNYYSNPGTRLAGSGPADPQKNPRLIPTFPASVYPRASMVVPLPGGLDKIPNIAGTDPKKATEELRKWFVNLAEPVIREFVNQA
ncbi:MAG: hypothetical protein NTV80_00220, partial [Verrucomicrobia bacterium]|nr:hypothetical protein [Verrucomicrobiota bacterium]